MRYAVIAGHVGTYPLSVLCRTLEVSVSGYYTWRRRMPSRHQQADEVLRVQIQHAFVAGRGVYGSPRVQAFLRHHGIRCSRKRIARLMRAHGWCAARHRRRKPHTTDSQHAYPVAPNLLERDFTATAPNRKWVADITGIETHEGWLYLAGIVDTYSRYAIGYAMDTRRDEGLVETALEMALFSRRPQAGLVHHSDRGSQYTSWGYRARLESQGIVLSMSGKGDPYDNALMESFFATLKAECVEHHEFQTIEQARTCIFEYLAVFYNRQRLHSALGYRSPMAFEQLPVGP
jgi:transposase InsO family protein